MKTDQSAIALAQADCKPCTSGEIANTGLGFASFLTKIGEDLLLVEKQPQTKADANSNSNSRRSNSKNSDEREAKEEGESKLDRLLREERSVHTRDTHAQTATSTLSSRNLTKSMPVVHLEPPNADGNSLYSSRTANTKQRHKQLLDQQKQLLKQQQELQEQQLSFLKQQQDMMHKNRTRDVGGNTVSSYPALLSTDTNASGSDGFYLVTLLVAPCPDGVYVPSNIRRETVGIYSTKEKAVKNAKIAFQNNYFGESQILDFSKSVQDQGGLIYSQRLPDKGEVMVSLRKVPFNQSISPLRSMDGMEESAITIEKEEEPSVQEAIDEHMEVDRDVLSLQEEEQQKSEKDNNSFKTGKQDGCCGEKKQEGGGWMKEISKIFFLE